jgi:phospholipid/cholesterol/gamma-HCH transport system substrate-binding protein
MDMNAHCSEPASKTNARGAQNAPRAGAAYRTGTDPVATYDLTTGTTSWNDQASASHVAYDGGAAQLYGEDSWKSLLLQPVM